MRNTTKEAAIFMVKLIYKMPLTLCLDYALNETFRSESEILVKTVRKMLLKHPYLERKALVKLETLNYPTYS